VAGFGLSAARHPKDAGCSEPATRGLAKLAISVMSSGISLFDFKKSGSEYTVISLARIVWKDFQGPLGLPQDMAYSSR